MQAVGFEVFTVLLINIAVFWDTTPCSLAIFADISEDLAA